MTEWYWLFAMMLFCHVIEDFHVQGLLANLKQAKWWNEHFDDFVPYNKDYIVALLIHGFEWSFFVHIPLMWFIGFTPAICVSLFVNGLLHSYIDDLKCNKEVTNLRQDQILHIVQIVISLTMIMVI